MDEGPLKELTTWVEHLEAKLRACRASVPRGQEPVRSPQGMLQGYEEEHRQLYVLFALANLVIAKSEKRPHRSAIN